MDVFKKVLVIGMGYIGLPTAAIFASRGLEVVGVDINPKTVEIINQGGIHIVEPDLDFVVRDVVASGKLRACLDPEPADVFIIAVPTPFYKEKTFSGIPQPDMSYIQAAMKAIAPVLKEGDLVILESTSPVGTTEWMAEVLAELRADLSFPQMLRDKSDIRIAYCPERVLPGNIMEELVSNDRIIGGLSERCSAQTAALYETFVSGKCLITNSRTAEMSKLSENSCRDVQIAFANELSMICDDLSINVWELIALANRHPRVNILNPGPGVGGHCIPVDPWFIVNKSPNYAQLIKTARLVNNEKPKWVLNKFKIAVADYLQLNSSKRVSDITVACYGLAFKADIDDLRESPANVIAGEIINSHAGDVLVVEPNIKQLPNGHLAQRLVSTDEALELADIHVMLVDHKEFRDHRPASDFIIDTRGIW